MFIKFFFLKTKDKVGVSYWDAAPLILMVRKWFSFVGGRKSMSGAEDSGHPVEVDTLLILKISTI